MDKARPKRLEDISTPTLIALARVISGDPAMAEQRIDQHVSALAQTGDTAALVEFAEGVMAFSREVMEVEAAIIAPPHSPA